MDLPSRDEVRTVLDGLLTGTLSPEEASEWARPWVTEEGGPVEVQDQAAWEAVCAIGMADLPSTDRRYLYGVDDFRAWRTELDSRP